MVILAAPRVDAAAAALRRSRGAEQGFEEIAAIRETAGAGPRAAELKTRAPVGGGRNCLLGRGPVPN